MRNPFDKLPEDKKELIIALSVREFSEKSFTDAATEDIARNAGIAKGSLFYYFGSKKGLYLYILSECVEKALRASFEGGTGNLCGKDMLIRKFYRRVMFCRENPEEVRFIQRASNELSPEIFAEKQKMMNDYIDRSDKIIYAVIADFIDSENLTVSRETATQILYMYWTGVTMFMLNRYKQEPERLLTEPEELYSTVEIYFNGLFNGICGCN